MNVDLARHTVRAAFRIGRELQDVMALLKQHLPEDQYRGYAADIAGAVHAANVALLDRPLAARPELAAEIDASIARYGRYL